MPTIFGPPFGDIWDGLKAGKVIPFLGAGASLAGRPQDHGWTSASAFPPTGSELAHLLADSSNFPSDDQRDRDDLAKVSSYTADISGRIRLRERLRDVLNHRYQRGELHKFLADIPAHLLIVVTNYDTLLEEAFRDAGKPYDLVVYPADRSSIGNSLLWWPHGKSEPEAVEAKELDLDLENTTVIYKMHGTICPEADKWDNFVITEEDYIEFLSRMTTNTSSAVPAQFYQYSRSRSFLFLGYSLRDWNLRVVLRNLRRHAEGGPSTDQREDAERPSWAIQLSPSMLEQRLWIRRSVEIFDMQIEEFVRQLAAWKARG
jgi:SIR2-like domain